MQKSLRRILWAIPAAMLVVPAALVLFGTGCYPGASWLPDSSRFVYAGGPDRNQLILYDVAKGKARVLVEKGVNSFPVVSPDGKRVAAAGKFYNESVEVAVFDLDGKELHRGKKVKWGTSFLPPQVVWVPGQDRLLLAADREIAFYDLKMGEPSDRKKGMELASFGGSPVRPDGKGFLAVQLDDDDANLPKGYVLVDWDGKETKIEPKTKGLFDGDVKARADDFRTAMLTHPEMFGSHWEGAAAVVRWKDIRITIDTEKLTAAEDAVKPEWSADKHLIIDQVRLTGGAVVRTVLTSPLDKKLKDSKHERRIEIQKPDENEAKTILEGTSVAVILPSPDGKTAVLRAWRAYDDSPGRPLGEDWLFVIDAKGDVAAKIDVYKTP